MNYFSLGLGFYQGWLWAFFLGGPLLYKAAGSAGHAELLFLFFLLIHSLSFLTLAILPVQPLLKYRIYALAAGAVLMFAGTLGFGFAPDALLAREGFLVVLCASAGIGGALLVAAWGELYSRQCVKQNGILFAGSVLLGTLLFFIMSFLDFRQVLPFVALLPLISFLFLYLGEIRLPLKEDAPSPPEHCPRCPLPPQLVVLLFLVYLAGGSAFKLINMYQAPPVNQIIMLSNLVYCLLVLLAGLAIFFNPEIDLRYIYRPVLPLLGAAFLLFMIPEKRFELPFSLYQAGFALFDTYTWLLFAYLAGICKRPLRVFGWGMFLITFPMFAGELFFAFILPLVTLTAGAVQIVSTGAAFFMLAAAVVLQGNRETFSGWSLKERNPLVLRQPVSVNSTGAQNTVIMGQDPLEIDNSSFFDRHNLTLRERDILHLLVKGRNNPYIKEVYNISGNTLKTHLRNLYRKFSVKNRQELISLLGDLEAADEKTQSDDQVKTM